MVTNRKIDTSVIARVKSIKADAVRTSLIESVTRDVLFLVERDRFTALECVMEATGYMDNGAVSSSEDFGAAITALSTILPLDRLRSAAVSAAFERSFLRPNLDEHDEEHEDQARWTFASRTVIEVMCAARARAMQAVAGRAA